MAAHDSTAPLRPAVWPLYLMPVVVIGGIFAAVGMGGAVEDAYFWLLPFLVTTWMGMGFMFAWNSLRYSMHVDRTPPVVVAGTGILSALIMFSMLGWDILWAEPWLFGVAIWPGFQMAWPFISKMLASKQAPAAEDGVPSPTSGPASPDRGGTS